MMRTDSDPKANHRHQPDAATLCWLWRSITALHLSVIHAKADAAAKRARYQPFAMLEKNSRFPNI